MGNFDFSQLVDSIINNGQFDMPATDSIRMGQVVGYDPNLQNVTADGVPTAPYYLYPMVSVTLAGSDTPLNGVRYSEHYVPNIGDMVWLIMTDHDCWVLGSLAGNPKSYMGQIRSMQSMIGRNTWTAATKNAALPSPAAITLPQLFSQSLAPSNQVFSVEGPILPNRVYNIEVNVSFAVITYTNATGLGVGITAPLSIETVYNLGLIEQYNKVQPPVPFPYLEIMRYDVSAGHTYKWTGTTEWCAIPKVPVYGRASSGAWPLSTEWAMAMTVYGAASPAPAASVKIHDVSIKIYDLGVAS